MRYMLLIYTKEDVIARSSAEEMQQIMNGHIAAMREAHEKGILQQAEPLPNTNWQVITFSTAKMKRKPSPGPPRFPQDAEACKAVLKFVRCKRSLPVKRYTR
jgi:hypothetical protein